MSVPKMEFVDPDSDDQMNTGLDIIKDDDIVVRDSPNAEYMLSSSDDNIIAYHIVHMPDDSPKSNQSMLNNSAATSVPQQLQYIVIDSSNGYLQAVPTTQLASVPTASVKAEPNTINQNSALKMRTSVAIAPKVDPGYLSSTPYSSTTTTNSTTSKTYSALDALSTSRKRDDRRRATHNEVERRRRDKINHWIMKLGNVIPADGSATEIGDSGRLSIAAIEGQSKGGILSKACEYVQMLQQKHTCDDNETDNSQTVLEKKKYEDEIARLRGENELLKAILIKNGINYVKERTVFKSNEYS